MVTGDHGRCQRAWCARAVNRRSHRHLWGANTQSPSENGRLGLSSWGGSPALLGCLRSASTPTMVSDVLKLLRSLVVAIVEFLAPRARLAAENLLLRQQLVILQRAARRPRVKPWERRLLSALAVRWSALKDAITIVKPATLLRWHRATWRWWWRRKSRGPSGRPPIAADLRALIRRFWRENATWGQKLIAAECGKLGWTVSPRTVAKYRPRNLDCGRGQSWRIFLRRDLSRSACRSRSQTTVSGAGQKPGS